MKVWSIHKTEDGRIAVFSPYHPLLVLESKKKMGRYERVIVKGKPYTTWVLHEQHKTAIETVCKDLFESEMTDRTVKLTVYGGCSRYSPTVDGYDVVWFSRDSHRVYTFKQEQPVVLLEIIEDNLDTSGSRNNPHLMGSITLRFRCRVQAHVGGNGWIVSSIE